MAAVHQLLAAAGTPPTAEGCPARPTWRPLRLVMRLSTVTLPYCSNDTAAASPQLHGSPFVSMTRWRSSPASPVAARDDAAVFNDTAALRPCQRHHPPYWSAYQRPPGIRPQAAAVASLST